MTQTPSRSPSGFPGQRVIDNTNVGAGQISSAIYSNVSVGGSAGIAWAFPEVDPKCGPGTYKLSSISLALSANATAAGLMFNLSLWAASAAPFPLASTVAYPTGITYAPNYVTFIFPPTTFYCNTLVSR